MANIVYMARSAWTGLLDTIRSKAGITGSMTVSQAADAVDSIETGGGGDQFKELIERTISAVSGAGISRIGIYAFYSCSQLSAANFPTVSCIYEAAFSGCVSLTKAIFPIATSVYGEAFCRCSMLKEVSMPLATYLGNSTFAQCSQLKSIHLPNATNIGGSCFLSCIRLQTVSLPKVSYINAGVFSRCYNLLSVYLMGSSRVGLAGNAFMSTPISNYTASTGGVHGSIFVPASLYDQYISALNWSVFSDRIVSVAE